MKVETVYENVFRIELDDSELFNLHILVATSANLGICDIPDLLAFNIGYLIEHATETVQEPLTHGNGNTPQPMGH